MTRLDYRFFQDKDTVYLAKDLLWKIIVRNTRNWILSWIINETEAYIEDDEASHTFGGKKTMRNDVMFKNAWHLYVYFTYGMYHCMNIVSENQDYWSAVLIRSIIPLEWIEKMLENRKIMQNKKWKIKNNYEKYLLKNLCNWPAKVCIALGVDKLYNWIDLLAKSSDIYLEDIWYETREVKTWTRIWISKAKDKLWRFYF